MANKTGDTPLPQEPQSKMSIETAENMIMYLENLMLTKIPESQDPCELIKSLKRDFKEPAELVKRINDLEKQYNDLKTAETEMNKAKDKQKSAYEEYKQKRAEYNKLINRAGTIPLVYEVAVEKLEELCTERINIYGFKDLFSQVLTIRRNDGDNATKPIKEKQEYIPKQISSRIREQGMREIEHFCNISKNGNNRVFQIKSMKDLSGKPPELTTKEAIKKEKEFIEAQIELERVKNELERVKNEKLGIDPKDGTTKPAEENTEKNKES